MKPKSADEMAKICGGIKLSFGCAMALIGTFASIAGAGISFATLNPAGVIIGVVGIYSGTAGVALSC